MKLVTKQFGWETQQELLATGILVDKTFAISPDKLILMSPWLDLSDENKDRKYLKNKDILLAIDGVKNIGEYYAGEYGVTNPILSQFLQN